MTDTLDLLDRIGHDASLRHAAPERLRQTLGTAINPDVLAAAAGEVDTLYAALGITPAARLRNHVTLQQSPVHESEPAHEGDDAVPAIPTPEEPPAASPTPSGPLRQPHSD